MTRDIQTIDHLDCATAGEELYCRLRQLEEMNSQLEQRRHEFEQYSQQLEQERFGFEQYNQRLEQEKSDLSQSLQQLEENIKRLQEENAQLYGWIRLFKQQKFGRSSEKQSTSSSKEIPLLPTLEALFAESQRKQSEEQAALEQASAEDCETIKVESYQRHKTGRKVLPDNLPREEVIHDLAEAEKVCPSGHTLYKIGEERSEQLEYVPAHLKVLEHVRYKYACKVCEENVKIAPPPAQPIPKSMAAPGLLSYILIAKFEDHLPFYRQSKIWKRHGVDLGRNTLSNWSIRCGELLSPLVNLLKEDIVAYDYIQADETTIQVLKEPGRKATTKSYMWAYRTYSKDKNSIVYDYHPTRSGKVACDFLKDFKGYLQTDAYQGYNHLGALKDIVQVFCWAHVRRKFVEVIKMTQGSHGKAQEAVDLIAKLYEIEKEAKLQNLPPDKVKDLRQKKAKPILEQIKRWLDEHVHRTLPKSPLGGAIRYALNHWQGLIFYLDDGRLSIDNNPCENIIRPFALGRKNWLFNDTVHGVKAAANIYSLIETCKANGINTFDYLNYVLRELPKLPKEADLAHLLPQNVKLGS